MIARRGVLVHRGREAERRLKLPVGTPPLPEGVGNAIGMAADAEVNALDLARLGHLALTQGRWRGEAVMDAGAERALRAEPANAGWVKSAPSGAYALRGLERGPARVLVIPEWEMVIVRLATDEDPPDADAVMNRFLERLGLAIAPLTDAP